jgi:sulfide:quinone oxidoreductase
VTTGKHRIVIVGGSFGGVNAAYQLRRKLGERVDLTLISADPDFTFIPSLPWVMMGWRRPEALKVPLARPLASKGVRFVHDRATTIDPSAQSVTTAGGGSFGYDHLVLATGADLDWSNVPGSDPAESVVHTCFTVEQAVAAREAIRRFVASDGGRAIIGANPGASCGGPAYEIIMMLETLLRRQKRRHLFDLHFVTPEPFLGHFGVNGIGNLSRMMKDEFRSRHLNWTTNAALAGIEPGKATLSDGAEMPFDLAVLIPAFYGAQVVRDVDGLGNPRGFVPTDRQLRSTRYPNIHAVGVSVAIAPPAATAVPVGVPKTGHMTEEMATRTAANIAVEVTGTGDFVD